MLNLFGSGQHLVVVFCEHNAKPWYSTIKKILASFTRKSL